MKGHLKKRSKDSWTLIVDLGRKPDGKRNQKWKTVKGTKKHAQEVLAELLTEYKRGTYVEPSKENLSNYLDSWLDDILDNVKPTTHERYKSICDFYISPILGEMKLQDLKPDHISSLYKTLKREGRPNGDKLSDRTILHTHRVLSNALNKAVKSEKLVRNPCMAVDAPKAARSNRLTFTSKETIDVLNKASGTNLFLPILLAVTTGLRRGEVLGLRWTDINFEKELLNVSQAVSFTKEGIFYDTPKTERSTRTIPLASIALNALKAYRSEQAKLYLKLGRSLNNEDPILSGIGGFQNPGQLTTNYRSFIKRNKFKHVTFHDLRHTHATLLLEENTHPKIVSDRLGHSTITLTMDTYSHVMPNIQREASDAINNVFIKDGFKS